MNKQQGDIMWPIFGFLIMLLIQIVVPSQFNGFTSPLHEGFTVLWDNPYSNEMLLLRETNESFYHRFIFRGIHRWIVNLGLTSQFGFTILSCLFILVNYWIIVNISQQLNRSTDAHKWISIFYFGSFPILFAYLGGIFTYEEPIQYFFLFMTLYFILKNKIFISTIFFTLALFSKETSILFLPVFFYFSKNNRNEKRYLIYLILSVVAYIISVQLLIPEVIQIKLYDFTRTTRFYGWQHNFATWQKTSETLFNILFVLLIPFILYQKRQIIKTQRLKWFNYGFNFLVIVNTTLVCLAGLAREARLFMLPLILFWPLVPTLVENVLKTKLKAKEVFLAFIPAVIIAWYVYQPSVYGTGFIYKGYAVIYLVLTSLLIQNDRIKLYLS